MLEIETQHRLEEVSWRQVSTKRPWWGVEAWLQRVQVCSLKDRVGNQLGAARVGGVRKALLRCETPSFLYKCELMSRYEKEALGVPGRRRGECLSSDSVRLNLVMMQDIEWGTKKESWGGRLGPDPGRLHMPHCGGCPARKSWRTTGGHEAAECGIRHLFANTMPAEKGKLRFSASLWKFTVVASHINLIYSN